MTMSSESSPYLPPWDGVFDGREFDEITYGVGGYRKATLEAVEKKDRLDPVMEFESLDELMEAVFEISLRLEDQWYMGPRKDTLKQMHRVYRDLPDEAQDAFLHDDVLERRINSARTTFNDWLGKLKRSKEIPSPVECGPANYNSEKAQKRSRYERGASEELHDALDDVGSAVTGAKSRALEAIGSSLAEHNEQKAQSERERMRDLLEAGDIVMYRTTHTGRVPWGVKRVNKKSVRLRRPHERAGEPVPMSDGEVYPEFDETRVDLDSDFLEEPLSEEDLEDAVDEDEGLPESFEEAQEYLLGDALQ
jgi:hypothetical protein